MSKFHINKHGVPAICKATKGNCPLGGDGEHFATRAEAQSHADKVNQEKFSLLGGIKKTLGLGQIKADNIHEYRGEYLKKKAENDPQDKLESLVYVINTIEEEDGTVGKTAIGRTANRIYSHDAELVTPERRFSDLLDKLNQLPDEQLNRHLNKLDDALGVDSTSGFVSPKSKGNMGVVDKVKKNFGVGTIKPKTVLDYRRKFYDEKLDMNYEDRIEALRYAVSSIEEEEGPSGESKLERQIERLASFDNVPPKRRFNDMVTRISWESEGDKNKYFDRLDKIFKVNSAKGFKHAG